MRTGRSPRLTLVQGGAGQEKNGSVSTTFGPVKVGLITPPRINKDQALSGSLNELERQVETLESKYLEVLDTLSTVIKHLAVLLPFTIATDITDNDDQNK